MNEKTNKRLRENVIRQAIVKKRKKKKQSMGDKQATNGSKTNSSIEQP